MDLDKLLEQIKEFTWTARSETGPIRCTIRGREYCPLTAGAIKQGKKFTVTDFDKAALELGFTPREARIIANAADTAYATDSSIRKRFYQLCKT